METKLLKQSALWLFLTAALCGFVIFPLRLYFLSDTVLSSTLWLDLLDLLFQWGEPILLSLICAFFLYGVYRYGTKNIRPLIFLSLGAIVFKYAAVLISDTVLMGAFDPAGAGVSALISIFAESAIAGFILFIDHIKITPKKAEEHARANAAKKLGREYCEKQAFFPFKKLLDFNNPLLSCAFFGILIITCWRTVSFIVDDLTYGQYQVSDIPFTLIYYTLYVLIPAAAGFFLCRTVLKKQFGN